jgi:hypothetical protein
MIGTAVITNRRVKTASARSRQESDSRIRDAERKREKLSGKHGGGCRSFITLGSSLVIGGSDCGGILRLILRLYKAKK